MPRVLYIIKPKEKTLHQLKDDLEATLSSIGLEKLGRVGNFEVAGPAFPSNYAFESAGEGGFLLTYGENGRTFKDTSRRDTVTTHVTFVPIGATGSLVQRTYEHLKIFGDEMGYKVFENKFN
jgi:hypothetical protein